MGQDDTEWKRAAKEVPELRFLKTLVTGLTLIMGVGMVAVVALLWMRLNQPVLPDLPSSIVLPEGVRPAAITFATDRIVVVTQTDQVLVYDRAGEPVGQLQLQP
ncbi:hypothetical protein E4191_07180 [Paracoccus liaowanqingii]|uniref:Uncharacterized protein n=1 Tax=Paracoccus liaowanqingii TaxID=2560053 RepID=A0A4P7HK47_9RHOB|nr:DUF6476 family protein [Paracoccus liaowanqingii]QBX34519.1 hypothetical protein E4191_07180 [Paracoccus liaowanqingii]